MANEVRSQRLMQFLGVVQNPVLAPFAKMDYIIREIAKSMDLDPDKLTNSMGDAAIQAEILKKFQADNPPPQVDPNAPPQQGAPSTRETQASCRCYKYKILNWIRWWSNRYRNSTTTRRARVHW